MSNTAAGWRSFELDITGSAEACSNVLGTSSAKNSVIHSMMPVHRQKAVGTAAPFATSLLAHPHNPWSTKGAGHCGRRKPQRPTP
jgi:hypothetical protein